MRSAKKESWLFWEPVTFLVRGHGRSDCSDTVNGFVGHTHALVFGILDFQPSGNLFRRPIQYQFTRNDLLQPHMDRKKTPFGAQCRFPGLEIGAIGSILRTASMTCDLPAHCRRNSIQASSYLANRRTGSEPTRSERRRTAGTNPP